MLFQTVTSSASGVSLDLADDKSARVEFSILLRCCGGRLRALARLGLANLDAICERDLESIQPGTLTEVH